ncbi:MAG TPA: toxin-antitoxin system YwqK family antitoxin [Verrucomicrobiae bacterium]|nr:toxin-antitoxin system YwqK family antitoxin [Verrucomicrobiae bacterium]
MGVELGLLVNKMAEGILKKSIDKTFYRSGQLREVVPLRNGRRHGVVRVWHKNGVLETEEPYQNGLLHGIIRQWSESGKLLGKYRMIHGTGIQRAWHENGKLQLEFTTVSGDFSGRYRLWLHDGALLSEDIYLHGRSVNAEEYHAARAKDKSLPILNGEFVKPLPETIATDKHAHEVFVRFLLAHKRCSEARKWLESGGKAVRSLGRFKRKDDALKFVAALYEAGATEVISPDIYDGKTGAQFADCLLVRLPKIAAKRKAIRKVCGQLSKRKLGAFLPDRDFAETHLYLSLA